MKFYLKFNTVSIVLLLTNELLFLQEVEDLVADKVVELVSSQSEIGELRQKVDMYQVSVAGGSRVARGRCYDHNFLRFLPIFSEKIGVFLKNHCYDHIFCKN
jgi:hypothetical protein